MANLTTLLSDLAAAGGIPRVFLPYMQQKTAQLSAFRQSGIVVSDPTVAALASGKGKTFDLPFWNDISGAGGGTPQSESQTLSDSTPLETKKITTGEQIAIALQRGEGWAGNKLVQYMTDEDPMMAIADRIANYWAIDEQGILIATADGVFADNAANDSSDLRSNLALETTVGVTAANKVSASALIDAEALLGDHGSQLGAIACHSSVYYNLRKQDLIDFIPDSEAKSQIATYQGKRLIVDDQLTRAGTTSGNVRKTFLFGAGAFMFGEGDMGNDPIDGGFGTEALELARDAAAGINKLFSRRRFILHPHGWKFASGSLAGNSPTNAELATASNWDRVFEKKNTRIVQLLTND